MSYLYEPEDEYLLNIPKYIQDIVFIHNFKYTLPQESHYLFDWYVDYVSHTPMEEENYPHPMTTIVED